MMYLDNAATSFPKPESVKQAVMKAMDVYGANPGRSGHFLSLQTAEKVFEVRTQLKEMFCAKSEQNIIFTQNCTQSLNMVIGGLLKENEHVIITCLEHNSVIRPVHRLSLTKGVAYDIAQIVPNDEDKTVENIERLIKPNTKLIVTTHASNVCGIVLPIEKIARMAKRYGLYYMVDAAQTAGMLPINLEETPIDFVAMPGHKGLYGPSGTGVLIAQHPEVLEPIYTGGTGSASMQLEQPDFSPDKFESGTINTAGIIGLGAGLAFLKNQGMENVYRHELKLITQIYDGLVEMEEVKLYTARPQYGKAAPVLCFTAQGLTSEEIVTQLSDKGICLRGGLHCSPLAHSFLGTIQSGAVRVSTGVFNTAAEVQTFLEELKKIVKSKAK